GDPAAAVNAADAAREVFDAHADRRNAGYALLAGAGALLDLDDVEAAVERVTRAMGEFDAIGDGPGLAESERLAGEARRRRGRRI
ncbi:MAG: hypothetical protein HOY71_25955, partial [Nonomuraea sp.]|nr:hypothetical protein [Nonomuraea sp.]